MMQPDCNQQPTRFRTGAARNKAGALTADEYRRRLIQIKEDADFSPLEWLCRDFCIQGAGQPPDRAMKTSEPYTCLKKIQLFEPLPEKSLIRLAEIAGLQRFAANSFIFEEGESPAFIYGISEGGVVLLNRASGSDSVVEFLGPGDSLLLPPVLMGTAYLASARTTSAVCAVLLPVTRFLELAALDPALSMQCAHSVSRNWNVLLGQVTEIKTHGATQRLAHFLLAQVSATTGAAVLTLPGMKKQVATRLGIKPETFSRTLKKLREHGVEASGDVIRIRAVERLRNLVSAEPFCVA
jgi:CRP-like cAMP-binding protein